jgi:hypothetical protein
MADEASFAITEMCIVDVSIADGILTWRKTRTLVELSLGQLVYSKKDEAGAWIMCQNAAGSAVHIPSLLILCKAGGGK